MNVIVVGFGRVGRRTVEVLDAEGHRVVVVDSDHDKAERARDWGLTVVEGDGVDEAILEEAGIADADAVGGLTGDVETNHAICVIGNEYGCRTVMRVSEDVSSAVYDRYTGDADDVIYPEQLGAAGAKTALLGGDFNAIGELTEGLSISVVRIPEGSRVVGGHVNEIDFDGRGRIYAHGRDAEPLTIPLPGTIVEAGDRLALLARDDQLAALREELLGSDTGAAP